MGVKCPDNMIRVQDELIIRMHKIQNYPRKNRNGIFFYIHTNIKNGEISCRSFDGFVSHMEPFDL